MMRFLYGVSISFKKKVILDKKLLTLLSLIYYLMGCLYDPPQKGTEIFVENQTHHFIYVLDSLPQQNAVSVYNHYYVNNKSYTAAHSGLLAPFTSASFFYSYNEYNKSLQKDSVITFSIFHQPDTVKIADSVWKVSSYRVFKVSSVRIHNNSINHIFVYDDLISYTNQYNIRFTEKGKDK